MNKEPVAAKKCACNCASCEECSKKNSNDIILESISGLFKDLSSFTKHVCGFVFSLAATIANMIVLYMSFPDIKTWKGFGVMNMIGSFFDFLPTEAVISFGFIMCCLSGYMHTYLEIGLTLMLAIASFYWAYSNGQWFALAASIIMFLYGLARAQLLTILPDFVLGMFQYTSFIVFGLLATNLAFNISNNLRSSKITYSPEM